MYMAFKHLHLTFVALTVLLFLLRAALLLVKPGVLKKRWLKVMPHAVDTLLLVSALALLALPLITAGTNPYAMSWIGAKVLGLLAYVGFSVYAFKYARSFPQRFAGAALGFGALLVTAMIAARVSPALGLF